MLKILAIIQMPIETEACLCYNTCKIGEVWDETLPQAIEGETNERWLDFRRRRIDIL